MTVSWICVECKRNRTGEVTIPHAQRLNVSEIVSYIEAAHGGTGLEVTFIPSVDAIATFDQGKLILETTVPARDDIYPFSFQVRHIQ